MTTLNTEVSALPGMGKIHAKALSKLGVNTARDLLFYFPYKYLDFSKFNKIIQAKVGEIITIRGKIKTIQSRFSFKTRKNLAEAILSDDTGSIKIIWFNQGYLAKSLHAGDEVLLSGRIEQYKGLQMVNPVHEMVTAESIHTGRLVPVYSITDGIYQRTLRTMVKNILPLAKHLEDIVPAGIVEKNNLLNLAEALVEIHFPTSEDKLTHARFRVSFNEVFIQQLAVQRHKLLLKELPAPFIPQNIPLIKNFLANLPFKLTLGQKKALWDIVRDMENQHPMNRLLEGDVGSGKTLVAVTAGLETSEAGFQVAVMAPTEILARQHYQVFWNEIGTFKQKNIALLTNSFHIINNKNVKRQAILTAIANGDIDIVIGTHAVLQQGIYFKNLGLVIIDEQHRFGVEQRSLLIKNSKNRGTTPHLLSMSATPIPRTLALSLYGDLDISRLVELPKGREAIVTSVVTEKNRDAAYDFIRKEIHAKRQAFIVTPRVEEVADKDFSRPRILPVKSVKQEFVKLARDIFPEFRLGLLYGSMKGVEKDKIMTQFSAGELDILVATTVIEIGIDVPNASAIVIESAEKFGLAQLHQLRGRVGRGKHKSYCILFSDSEDVETKTRLQMFARTQDGFKLAKIDLEQRGFGSLFGTEQTGFDFKFHKFLTIKVLQTAKTAAQNLLAENYDLSKYPKLKTLVEPKIAKIHLE